MRVSTQKEKVNHRSRVQSILAPLIQLLSNLNNTMAITFRIFHGSMLVTGSLLSLHETQYITEISQEPKNMLL